MDDYSRRSNLKIEGIPETIGETDTDLSKVVLNFFSTHLGIDTTSMKFERCHRLGPKTGKLQRKIIVRFNWFGDRTNVWNKKYLLSGKKFVIREDYS